MRAIWASPEERHVSVSSLCSTCSATGHSARECPSKTVGIYNSCGDKMHQQHDALLTRLCVHCQEHGHDEAKCFRPKYRACCRSTLRNARNFECRERKCTHEMQRRDGSKRACAGAVKRTAARRWTEFARYVRNAAAQSAKAPQTSNAPSTCALNLCHGWR